MKQINLNTVTAALLIGFVMVALFSSNPVVNRFIPPCPVNYATGLYCPGCGSMRATHHLLHGRLDLALRFNPILFVAIPAIGLLLLRKKLLYLPATPWIVLVVILVYTVFRNLSAWPFSLLAPG